jgi:hypothetical protein
MPSARAFAVMRAANSSSLPEIASATTTAASFADLVTRPLMASWTLIVWLGLSPSLVGFCSEARVETGSGVSSLSLPASSSSNSR